MRCAVIGSPVEQATEEAAPLGRGLRVLRRVLLEPAGVLSTLTELLPLVIFGVVATALSMVLVRWSFDYARRTGTLSQD